MTILEMLQQSAVLTVLGISVVFVFLWVMILTMNFTGNIFSSLEMKKETNQQRNVMPQKNDEVTAAVITAISEHEKRGIK
jgi:sodium pump decarboxylase gamma subunit